MLKFDVVSLFPEMLSAVTDSGIPRRAIEKGLASINAWNPRDYATDRHRTVDDRPYGGGAGMVMMVQPLRDAIHAAKASAGGGGYTIYLSPQGKQFNHSIAKRLATTQQHLILVAGRYEGVDERLIASEVDEEISIGDYVLSGGELPAMVLIDAVVRLLPNVLGAKESAEQDSFANGILDFPHYTRPEEIDGMRVPEVLLSGDHAKIAKWREQEAVKRTKQRRQDLLAE